MIQHVLRFLAAALGAAILAGAVHAATVQVRVEVGSRLPPLPPDAVIRLERNGPAVSLGPFFTLAYVGDTFVVQALRRNPLPSVELPFGLDVYRGDLPLVGRQSPRCNPAEGPVPCTPDTAVGFLAWSGFPTDPAVPRVVPLEPWP